MGGPDALCAAGGKGASPFLGPEAADEATLTIAPLDQRT
jgi:hypothetical protein